MKNKTITENLRLEQIELICDKVAEGETLRQIGEGYGVSAGTILRWVTATPESEKQYTRARDIASDIFEGKAIDAAMSATRENAAADRILVDTLKWAAGNRSPKKYGSRVQADLTSTDGSMSPKILDTSKLSNSALAELIAIKDAKSDE